ncbi:MAG: arginase family protein [Paludibacteraceae bacterium]|nr:arginase family protein [Paludibacteraceae bacterium]
MLDSIQLYFTSPSVDYTLPSYMPEAAFMASNLHQKDYTVALIGIPDSSNSANEVRKHLYTLFGNFAQAKICDLGNIKQGKTDKEMSIALEHVLQELSANNIPCVVFGGEQWLSTIAFKAISDSLDEVAVCVIDSKIDVGDMTESICSHSFLNQLSVHPQLASLDIIGTQQYYSTDLQRTFIRNHKGHNIRLAQARKDIFALEPTLRYANLVSIDMSAIRMSDAPAANFPCPNGFAGEEACQLARFSGYADKTNIFMVSSWNTAKDPLHHTSLLVADIVWHFLEGVNSRQNEQPSTENPIYTKFVVQSDINEEAIVFYHNDNTDRWWIEIPTAQKARIFPCHLSDYEAICKNEIPELWLRFVYK